MIGRLAWMAAGIIALTTFVASDVGKAAAQLTIRSDSGYLNLALTKEPNAITLAELQRQEIKTNVLLHYKDKDGKIHPLLDALDRANVPMQVVGSAVSRAALLAMVRTLGPGEVVPLGYVGDDRDWHALSEADLRQACVP